MVPLRREHDQTRTYFPSDDKAFPTVAPWIPI